MERTQKFASRKKRKTIQILTVLLLIIITAILIIYFVVLNDIKNATELMYEPINGNDVTEEITDGKPISILMIGVDERSGDKGRADTLIYITANPKTEKMQMVSIPRDTRTLIVGKDVQDKINHSYSFGGVEMTVKTVEHFLDLPVHYYIRVNMESFKDIVNIVGGVTVQNDLDFWWEGEHFPKGELHLDGKRALIYSRMRKVDPKGDFGRQDRQQQVIESVVNKGVSFSTVKNYNKVLETLGDNVKTNLSFDEMKFIQKNYAKARKNVQRFHMTGSGKNINGIYYYIPNKSSLSDIKEELKENLKE